MTNLYNYCATLTPLKAGKVRIMLENRIKHNDGKVYPKSEYYRILAAEGYTPEIKENAVYIGRNGEPKKPKTEYRIVFPVEKNLYYDVPKMEFDYFCYLLNEGANTPEGAQRLYNLEENARLEAERIEKEKAKQEAAEKQKRIEFDKWIISEAERLKSEGDPRIVTLEAIFLNTVGSFGGGSIRLLVLIDNFDNPLAKAGVISWLHNDNKASIKAFEVFTGIKLPKTYKERIEALKALTGKDFIKGGITFKPRQKHSEGKENANTDTYYINESNATQVKFTSVIAEGFTYNSIELFIRKNHDYWEVSEAKSGLKVATSKNRVEAKQNAKQTVDKIGVEKFNLLVRGAIEKYGISPRYEQKEAI